MFTLAAAVLFTGATVASSVGGSHGSVAVDSRAVDRFVEAELHKHGTPGATAALVEDGRVTPARTVGLALPLLTAVVVALTVRSALRLRGWRQRAEAMSPRQLVLARRAALPGPAAPRGRAPHARHGPARPKALHPA